MNLPQVPQFLFVSKLYVWTVELKSESCFVSSWVGREKTLNSQHKGPIFLFLALEEPHAVRLGERLALDPNGETVFPKSYLVYKSVHNFPRQLAQSPLAETEFKVRKSSSLTLCG